MVYWPLVPPNPYALKSEWGRLARWKTKFCYDPRSPDDDRHQKLEAMYAKDGLKSSPDTNTLENLKRGSRCMLTASNQPSGERRPYSSRGLCALASDQSARIWHAEGVSESKYRDESSHHIQQELLNSQNYYAHLHLEVAISERNNHNPQSLHNATCHPSAQRLPKCTLFTIRSWLLQHPFDVGAAWPTDNAIKTCSRL